VSVAVFVTTKVLNSEIVRSLCGGRTGAVFVELPLQHRQTLALIAIVSIHHPMAPLLLSVPQRQRN
jgi:hypothetical protein